MKRIVIILFAMLVITSCAPDPRREASAYATRKAADTAAGQAQQDMRHEEEVHDMWMSRLNDVSAWASTMVMTSMIASMFAIFVALVSTGIGFSFVSIGTGIGFAKRQLTRPNQIRLDPVTRQFPLLITQVGDGKYSLSNSNTGSVTMLYERNEADRLLIAAMSATQHAGALGHEARLSHKPEAIAQIQAPQILEVE